MSLKNNIKDGLTGKSFVFFMVIFFISHLTLFAQEKPKVIPSPMLHHEVMDDEFIPVNRENQPRSAAYRYFSQSISTVQVNVDEYGLNILGDAANEPSFAIDRNNPNKIAIGWRQFNTISSNFRQAGYGFSEDGGLSWTFPGVIDAGVFRSDPVLNSDLDGNFYYNSLTNNPTYFCSVYKSSNGGADWDNGTFAQGGDKQWMTIDKTNGSGSGHIYASWTYAYSVCEPNFFTRSTDEGESYENCTSIPGNPYWGTLAIGPNGELYSGGSQGYDFLVAKSTNAQNAGEIVTWDFSTSVDLDGSISYGDGPNPGGLLGQTIIGVDTSNGPYRGYVYLLCSVSRHSNNDPADVMFSRSTNGGLNWSSPIKINDDSNTTKYQWFGTMSVAPNGRIDVVWLDTRNSTTGFNSALYYSNSKDGGITWSVNERISDFFNPHVGWPQQQKMGDYFDMISDSAGAFLAWAATFNGEQDVYFSRIIDPSGPVPVELTNFSSYLNTNKVFLNWSTATELNNRGFEIERSLDKDEWRIIGFKEGKGTTSEPQQYSYSDDISEITASKLYYRLKQIDYNGNYKYSEIVEVEIAPKNFSLAQNYPNPFNPITSLQYAIGSRQFVTLKVYDLLGREIATLVNEEKPAGSYEVEFSAINLPGGVYFYQLKAGDFRETKKMILLK